MPLWNRGRFCLCGGKYLPILGGDYGECERVDCPRSQFGDGSWHKALPKLQELDRKGLMRDRFPDIDLNEVVEAVFGQGVQWRCHRYQPTCRNEVNDHQHASSDERERKSRLRWEHRGNAPSTEPPASPACSSTGKTPPPLANPATTPLCGQQPDLRPAITTMTNNNHQEANPEGAEQRTSVHSLQAPDLYRLSPRGKHPTGKWASLDYAALGPASHLQRHTPCPLMIGNIPPYGTRSETGNMAVFAVAATFASSRVQCRGDHQPGGPAIASFVRGYHLLQLFLGTTRGSHFVFILWGQWSTSNTTQKRLSFHFRSQCR